MSQGDDTPGNIQPVSVAAPLVPDWAGLASAGQTYLMAGAWQSAHALLWPILEQVWVRGDPPQEALRPACLAAFSCIKLGHKDHLSRICDWLRGVVPGDHESDKDAMALASICLAVREVQNGDYQRARSRISLHRVRPRALSTWTSAQLSILQCQIALREGALGAADRHALRAVEVADSGGSTLLRAEAYLLLATVAHAKGKLREASSLYAEAATHYWLSGDFVGQTKAQNNRGWALAYMGQLPAAARVFAEALRRATPPAGPAAALRASLGSGWVAVRSGQMSTARSTLLTAWREARRLGLPREEALALDYIAEMHTLSGSHSEAALAVRLCKRLARRLPSEGDVALAIKIRESMLSVATGKLRAAIPRAREAAKHAGRACMRFEEAQARRTLAIALAAIGRRHDALAEFHKALGLLEGMDEELERHVVRAWIDALEQTDRSRRPQVGGARTAAAPDADPVAGRETKRVSNQGTTPPALAFWLAHPLLSPDRWLRNGRHSGPTHLRPTAWVRSGNAPTVEDSARPEGAVSGDPAGQSLIDHPCGARGAGSLEPAWTELGFVTRTPALIATLRLAEIFAPSMIPVLVLGETGTGKDYLAQGLHSLAGRTGRYVPINCALASRELFVAELFGARRGAYTGAVEHRRGLIEEADGGTVFFDEIADLEPEAQGFLLRFLDSGEVRSLGETVNRRVSARVIAATCQDLAELVRQGRFRRDLHGRLAGTTLRLPPLRERRMDLELLAEMLWQRDGGDPSTYCVVFTPEAIAELRSYAWPENVRELRHAVDRAILLSRTEGPRQARAELTAWLDSVRPAAAAQTEADRQTLRSGVAASPVRKGGSSAPGRSRHPGWDPAVLRKALETADGFVPEAALVLGISHSYAYKLYRKLKAHGAQ